MLYPTTLYVIECESPGRYYVGTTYRSREKRFKEHFEGWGCRWTRKHGCKRIVHTETIDRSIASNLENKKWLELARQHGPENVRGGDVTYVNFKCESDTLPDWLLPIEFGGKRIVDWD